MLSSWSQQFQNCEPISHWLREAFINRWVRFHSLPGSKRYAGNENEYAIILDRHNRVLSELTGAENKVVLLTGGWSESSDAPRHSLFRIPPQLQILDPTAKAWRSVPMHIYEPEDFLDSTFFNVFASEHIWHPGLFDPIIRLAANFKLENLMIIPHDCSWLLLPYDGGMDVITESPAKRDILKNSHLDWLSKNPGGL